LQYASVVVVVVCSEQVVDAGKQLLGLRLLDAVLGLDVGIDGDVGGEHAFQQFLELLLAVGLAVAIPAVAAGTTTVNNQTVATLAQAAQPAGKYKLNPIGMSSYVRLYPGVDGMATNGLRYGAAVELRTNYFSGSNSSSGTSAAISPSANSNLSSVFVRRNFLYLAHENFGLLRMGQTDGLGNLLDPGIYTQGGGSFDGGVGTFNGAMLQGIGPSGSVGLPYPWFRDASADYDAVKMVYLTPQFMGFDAGIEYAPSMGDSSQQTQPFAANGVGSNCTQANTNCIGLTTGTDGTRWYNKYAVGARWQGTFGPIDAGIYGIYTTASREKVFGAAAAFDDLSLFNIAGGVQYRSDMGTFALSANYVGGQGNGTTYSLRPKGGAPLSALMVALTWKQGPWVVGGAAELINSQGSAGTGTQRREMGLAVAGSYALAPGFTVGVEYMYQTRHQGGVDFNTGAAGTVTRDAKSQGIMFMSAMNW